MYKIQGSASFLATFNNGTNDSTYWIVAGLVILAVEWNGISAPGKSTQKLLASVSGTIHGGLILTVILYLVGVLLNS